MPSDLAIPLNGSSPFEHIESLHYSIFAVPYPGFKMFDQNLSLTAGEPAKATQLLALNIYDTFYARSGKQWKGISHLYPQPLLQAL